MKAQVQVNDKVKTLMEVRGSPRERCIPIGTEGIIIEAYENAQGDEGYAVDFALPEASLVGGFAYANAYLIPEQFEVIERSVTERG